MRTWRFEDGGFLALILLVSFAFAWLIAPFFGAVLWGTIIAILFRPIFVRLERLTGGRPNLAASLCLLLIFLLVLAPAFLIAVSLIQEAASIYVKLESGEIDLSNFFRTVREALPDWAGDQLARAGFTDLETALEMLGSSVSSVFRAIASRALWFGQGALGLLASLGVMLYLAFFLLRDGEEIGARVREALPLRPEIRDPLINHFVVVIKATMRGTVVVSLLQGLAGGIIFWLIGIEAAILWGLLMALFSLFPAVGTGAVWVPVAVYLFATGSFREGAILTFCGFFVIGLIDNLLRPILVGHDAKLPEFVVLITTVAGLALMGLNGVIVGPIIAALFMSVWRISAQERARKEEQEVESESETG